MSLSAAPDAAPEEITTPSSFDDLPEISKTITVDPSVIAEFGEQADQHFLTVTALRLNPAAKYEYGAEIKLPDGTNARFIRLRSFENRIFFVRPKLVIPQPQQPREYFDPEKLLELAATIASEGQRDPIHYVFIVKDGENVARPLIIDGERRFRVAIGLGLPYVKMMNDWVKNGDQLFERSFMLNVKEPHTVFEIARAYKRMVEARMAKGMDKPDAVRAVAKVIGKSTSHVGQHLGLDVISPKVRKKIGDKLSLGTATQLARAVNDTGGKIDQEAIADKILENPNLLAARGTGTGKVTRAAIDNEIRKQLEGSGVLSPEQKLEMEAGDAIAMLQKAVFEGLKACDALRDREKLIPQMIDRFQHRRHGKPADVIAEDIRELLDGLREWFERVLKPATHPPRLEKPANAPSFRDHLESRKRSLAGHPLRERIARILAYMSDQSEQAPVTVRQIVEILKGRNVSTDSTTVASNLSEMEEPLRAMGFEIDEHIVRRRSEGGTKTNTRGRTDLQKISAYRLRWTDEMLEEFERAVPAAGGLPRSKRQVIVNT